jgi:predicted ATPase
MNLANKDFFVTMKSKPKLMENNMLILGPDGTGKTTLAKALQKNYSGTYYSVHERLCSIYEKQGYPLPVDREEFTRFANALRREHNDPAYAVHAIVDEIFTNNFSGIHIIESIQLISEMQYLQNTSAAHKADLLFIGINAYPDDRLHWINKNELFTPVAAINGAILITKENSDWCEATEFQPNIDGCLEQLPIENLFYNEGDGTVDKIFKEVHPLIFAIK